MGILVGPLKTKIVLKWFVQIALCAPDVDYGWLTAQQRRLMREKW